MPWGAAAAAVVGVVGAVSSADAQKSGAKKAANASVSSADAATELQRETYYDQRALLAPAISGGAQARAKQMLMMGYTPDQVKAYLMETEHALANPSGSYATTGGRSDVNLNEIPVDPSQFDWVDSYDWQSSSPSYDFRFDEGQRALERSAAANGGLFSGATGRELTRYGQEFGAQEFEADYDRFGRLAGDGTEATGTVVNVAGQFGNAAAANTLRAGQARASGYRAIGQANADMYSGIADSIIGGIGYGTGYFG